MERKGRARRRSAGLIGVLISILSVGASAQGRLTPCLAPEYRQFDFWLGDWDVVNRQRRPDGTTWGVTGRATDKVYPVAGGCGIVEQWRGDAAQGYVVGYSLRAWNPETHAWDLVLLWPRPEQPRFATLHGGFRHGRGDFFRSVTGSDGSPMKIRLTFSDVTANSLRWNNGTSRDGGRSWSTTWVMEFSRRDPLDDPLLVSPSRPATRLHVFRKPPLGRMARTLEGRGDHGRP